MKLFIDTANLDEIRTAASWGLLDGVTTNPTLLSREKGNFRQIGAQSNKNGADKHKRKPQKSSQMGGRPNYSFGRH